MFVRNGGTDRVDCGKGEDTAVIDDTDKAKGCEKVRRELRSASAHRFDTRSTGIRHTTAALVCAAAVSPAVVSARARAPATSR